ncbi:hypothetical protein ENUP19_0080G0036 [Entamoeba nuttalli]|uniref:Uncharacterized protein n=2 Tax=Entamoeba nuttalli TaxID=412467 RepID=K2GJB0_ENTNP|nr:hypothetical protein ENU1_007960 [Entamoeba nuttalli P19]EKE42851.1 hypothetical protein ENU1_007960 [Entamoeba nuttalli P19]|eukprot:XP_008854820.1 hypothetical protein ENU1_007960 [Entamoeba nuttalli P19]
MSNNNSRQDDFDLKKEEQIESTQQTDFNSRMDLMSKQQNEDQRLFEQKLKEAIKAMNEEIESYKSALEVMKKTYVHLLDETRNEEEKGFDVVMGKETRDQKLKEIQEKMIELNTLYNAKSKDIKTVIENAAKKLKFEELKQMKMRVQEMINSLKEYKSIMEQNAEKSEEIANTQKTLNQQLGYVLNKKKLVTTTKEQLSQFIKNKNSDEIERLYQIHCDEFFQCELEPNEWLNIPLIILNNIETHCSTLKIEIVIDSLEKFAEVQGSSQLSNDSLSILNTVNSHLSHLISSPLAIQCPNSVTAYRISQTIYAEYTTASPTVPTTFSL